jgi:proteasome lid subunit RPN8/RPN11
VIARVILGAKLRDLLAAEAAAAFPRECCGLIEGMREETAVRALAFQPTRNIATRADRFEIDPAAQFGLLRRLRGTGREIVGCYHSHPNGAPELSACDREGAFESDFLWFVVAITAGATNLPPPCGEAGEPASLSASCSSREPGGGKVRSTRARAGDAVSQMAKSQEGARYSGFANQYEVKLATFVVEADTVREVPVLAAP